MKKLQLRVGAYYRRRDGLFVGPAKLEEGRRAVDFGCAISVHDIGYYSNGRLLSSRYDELDLVEEVDANGHPIRPTPKKRAGGRGMVTGWFFTMLFPKATVGAICQYESCGHARSAWRALAVDYPLGPIVRIQVPAPTPKPATKAKGMTK